MDNPQPITLAIVFVLYSNYDDLDNFLARQIAYPEGLRLVVIDNTPHHLARPTKLSEWEQKYGISARLAEPANAGYFGAGRFALRAFPELLSADYLAISNTDVMFQVCDVVEYLRKEAASHSGVGVIAPRLTDTNGAGIAQLHYVTKPSRRRLTELARISSWYPIGVTYRLAGDAKRRFTREREIPRQIFAPHGALMIMTRTYFQSTAGFAHPCFLFFEEISVGWQCANAGLTCIYEPGITYSHCNHGSMGSLPSRRVMRFIREASLAVQPMLD